MMPLVCVLGFGTSFCRIEEQVYCCEGNSDNQKVYKGKKADSGVLPRKFGSSAEMVHAVFLSVPYMRCSL